MKPAAGPALSFRPLGDRCLRVGFGDTFDDGLAERIRSWCRSLARARLAGVVEWVPSYTAVTLAYEPRVICYAALCDALSTLRIDGDEDPAPRRRLVIPVLYGGEAGSDLPEVAAHACMTADEVVQRHSAPAYRVVMIGFAPGFPYLSGLDPALAVPRLDRPRVRVPAGSVGIGGEQTGVYTLATPGGWRIIGRTPVPLFDPGREPPSLLAPGDEVRFLPMDHGACAALEESLQAGGWSPAWEVPV